MRGIQSKRLMKLTRQERANEKDITERGLVQKKSGSVVNSPFTIRAMYQQLKRRFRFVSSFAGEVKLAVTKARDTLRTAAARKPDRIAIVQKPLMLILQHCQPHQSPRDPETWLPHPTYAKARRAADRGDGAEVMRIARQFA